jgi:hypothetical protein
MLNEKEIKEKLEITAEDFRNAVQERNYMRAKALYNKALAVATFVRLDPEDMENLFGYREDVGEDTEAEEGLFPRYEVSRVDLECCVKRNKAYEDMTVNGRFYSDEDYCARCRKRKDRMR